MLVEVEKVRIVSAAASHPQTRIGQDEAAARMSAKLGDHRRVYALAHGTRIESRASILSPDAIGSLTSIQERNAIYEAEAPRLAEAAANALETCFDEVSFLVTSSCTGYMVPGLDVQLAARLGLQPAAARLPITEAGCAGGVVALARSVDRLRLAPSSALVVAAELCSLAFHADPEEGNLTAALLFGDGAGAVYLRSGGDGPGIEVCDSASFLVPCTQQDLGFRLTDAGFYPLLARSLPDHLAGPTSEAVGALLRRHGLSGEDIAYWLIHPGGPRVLSTIVKELNIAPEAARWSWQVLRCSGNTSSAAIIEVIARYLADAEAPRGWGVALAFGPGISIEMLLLHRC